MNDGHKILIGLIVGLVLYHFYMKSQTNMGGSEG